MTADMKTNVKLWLMWLLIGAGELAIFADTWRRVDGRYASEGLITEALMSVIMGGIPGVAFAGVVYVVVEFLAKQFAPATGKALTTYTAEVIPPEKVIHHDD